jgi:hypothetical protein
MSRGYDYCIDPRGIFDGLPEDVSDYLQECIDFAIDAEIETGDWEKKQISQEETLEEYLGHHNFFQEMIGKRYGSVEEGENFLNETLNEYKRFAVNSLQSALECREFTAEVYEVLLKELKEKEDCDQAQIQHYTKKFEKTSNEAAEFKNQYDTKIEELEKDFLIKSEYITKFCKEVRDMRLNH